MAASAAGEILTSGTARKSAGPVTDSYAFEVGFSTGDVKGAGTDAKVGFRLYDDKKNSTKDIELEHQLNQITPGSVVSAKVPMSALPPGFGSVSTVEVWRNNFGVASEWFLETIKVEDIKSQTVHHFTSHRWIHASKRYFLYQHSTLPQFDEHKEHRLSELEEKRLEYEYTVKAAGLPVQGKQLPDDERFSDPYKWDIEGNKRQLLKAAGLNALFHPSKRWESVEDIKQAYKFGLSAPVGSQNGHWDNDVWFGLQRVQGCNPFLLTRCKEIPTKMPVDIKRVEKILGANLDETLSKSRLFIVDLSMMDDVICKDDRKVAAPIALFYLDKKDTLLPLAIQLYQQPDDENPIFYKDDHSHTWQMAKLWYNHADANYHQSVSHLGFTHLMMEGASICTHRQLSTDHPIYKLLAPHFLYLMAINSAAIQTLVNPGGWVDQATSVGVVGMFELIRRASEKWRMDVHGNPNVEFEERGVIDAKVLPNYPYRDDALAIYSAIRTYVKTVVEFFYDTTATVQQDYELQAWAAELVKGKTRGGCGLRGIPGNGHFTTTEQLITTISGIIYTCSVVHAGANFNQYDEYGFPPNYPLYLEGPVPTKKINFTEKDIVNQLPSRDITLNTMAITTILSRKGTQPLGEFEVKFMYDAVAVKAAQTFRTQLKEISEKIKKRNETLTFKYLYLDPENVPNSISV
jgi:arachidonate 5-lipoxygenase